MGKVTARFVRTEEEASRFIQDLNLGGQGVIIKPNWTSPDYGNCTDAQTLEWFLSRIPGPKYVIEGYIWARNDNSRSINVDNVDQNRDWIREQDRWFLRTSGIDKVLEKYDAPYINITEEFWQGRTMAAGEIQALVEAKYPPIEHDELYGAIPQKLFALRNLPLVSLAKIKYRFSPTPYATLSMKNLFGLIPDVDRHPYHGDEQDSGLSRSIVDINTIYRALFRVVGVNEAIHQGQIMRDGGQYNCLWAEYDTVENLGLALSSEDLLTLDAFTNRMVGIDPEARHILQIGSQVFGEWDRDVVAAVPSEMSALFPKESPQGN
jgi:uncharacterized protein (DUF362 family)